MGNHARTADSTTEEEQQCLLTVRPASLGDAAAQLPGTRSPRAQKAGSHSLSTQESTAAGKDTGICRICLEEDQLANLEAPCGCTGTQRYAHHACIQRWVDEKGNAKCEICEQPYRGQYTVPPQPVGIDSMPIMYVLEASDPRAGHRSGLDLLDTESAMYHRNPSVSWCVTFIVFFLFLVVLHHTLIMADGMDVDQDPSHAASGGTSPYAPTPAGEGSEADSYTDSMLLFLFWVASKAFLIGVPLYTVMKIAARQARREQYEAMVRAAYEANNNRRMLLRVHSAQEDNAPHQASNVAVANAV